MIICIRRYGEDIIDFCHISEIAGCFVLNQLVKYSMGTYENKPTVKSARKFSLSYVIKIQSTIRGNLSRLKHSYIRLKEFRKKFPKIKLYKGVSKSLTYIASNETLNYTAILKFKPLYNNHVISGHVECYTDKICNYHKKWNDINNGKLSFTFEEKIPNKPYKANIICGSWIGTMTDNNINLDIRNNKLSWIKFRCIDEDFLYQKYKKEFNTSEKNSRIIILKIIQYLKKHSPYLQNVKYSPYKMIKIFLSETNIYRFEKKIHLGSDYTYINLQFRDMLEMKKINKKLKIINKTEYYKIFNDKFENCNIFSPTIYHKILYDDLEIDEKMLQLHFNYIKIWRFTNLNYFSSKLKLAYKQLALLIYCKHIDNNKYKMYEIFTKIIIPNLSDHRLIYSCLLDNNINQYESTDWVEEWYSFKKELNKIEIVKLKKKYELADIEQQKIENEKKSILNKIKNLNN